MNVGFIGLGKLGLPVALAVESKGHKVYGYDVSRAVTEAVSARELRYTEAGAQELLDKTEIEVTSVKNIVAHCDLIFVAVQTPHQPEYEGVTPIPEDDADFNYTFLIDACKSVIMESWRQSRNVTLAIISTVLPGTVFRDIRPMLHEHVRLAYNPFFIAMGTAIQDFLHPEFVLLGVSKPEDGELIREFYATITNAEVRQMSIPSAELTKVAYNTFISMKIGVVNTLAEICHFTPGAKVDEVTDALKLATRRIVSPAYMTAGMGDGGGCHPRDCIAMSYLADDLEVSFNPFRMLMAGRQEHAKWIAFTAITHAREWELPLFILGKSFKPETNIETGSPALLVAHYVKAAGMTFEHHDRWFVPQVPGVYLIATKHPEYAEAVFPIGSVVVDPFRYVPAQEGVERVRLGECV